MHHHHLPCNLKPFTTIFSFFFLLYLSLHNLQTIESRNPSQFTNNPTPDVSIPEIKLHLQRYGYLPQNNDVDDVSFEQALSRYQKNLGLPITGKPDSDTLSHILLPRCGFPDDVVDHKTSPFHTSKKYVYFPGRPRWTKDVPLNLTYAFSQDNLTPYLTPTEIRRVFRRAFAKWASVIPVSFVETEDYVEADIKIGFFAGDHGDGEPFDGVLGVLAHTFSPENGRLHLDKAETWAVDFDEEKSGEAVDLESVAVHEIGHVLGLGHSSVKDAAMYPTLKPRSKKVNLNVDDVVGVQSLYGTNPNFTLSSLLASETSTNLADGSMMRPSQGLIYSTLTTVMAALCFLNW
ncbi:PREDICTED: metalloendoproteinase 4-MMP-like [Camelina sativa]|uniref:Metalloendoproteinase 4-MMP-like n=1 Tax=Camelina sativa TaxID=90675 RepID=A0ABM0YZ95_CAMSA|nr:PREDICTED: metalloendoproteinase 4-MMP-like [Camelina sativa]